MTVPTTIVDALFHQAERRPDAPFVTFLEGGRSTTTTYADLLAGAAAVAAQLEDRRVERHVLLVHPNGPAFFTDFLGAVLSGRVPVPVAPPTLLRHPDGYLAHVGRIASRCETSTVLTTAAQARNLPSTDGSGLRIVALDGWDDGGAVPSLPRPEPAPSDVAFLQFTSGSTSYPRGVRVTHANIAANLGRILETFEIDEQSSSCTWLPLFHDMGLIGCGLAAMFSGGHLVLMTPTSFLRRPSRWLDALTTSRATHAATPCFGLDHALQRVDPAAMSTIDLSSLRHVIIGGDVINPRTVRRFCAAFEPRGLDPGAIRPSYGMAESTLLVTTGRGLRTLSVSRRALQAGRVEPPPAPEDGSEVVACGGPASGHHVEVVGPDGSPVAPGDPGELVISGPSVTDGYHGDDEATAAVFLDRPDGTRALRSGDLGFIRDGDVYITGRVKDLIVVRGRNVHPEDVEAVLAIEVVGDEGALGAAAVIAVEGDDGEALAVVQEAQGDDDRLDDDASRIVAAVLAACDIRPVEVLFVPMRSLPRTSSGKLQRSLCRKLHAEGRLRITRRVAGNAVGTA